MEKNEKNFGIKRSDTVITAVGTHESRLAAATTLNRKGRKIDGNDTGSLNVGAGGRQLCLSSQYTDSTGALDLLFSEFAEEFGFNNDGLFGQISLSENLEETGLNDIDDGGFVGLVSVVLTGLFGNQSPQFIEIDSGAVVLVLGQMEFSHSEFTEMSGMILPEQSSVVMLSGALTTTSRMLSVLSNTTVTGTDVTSLLSVLV
mmetsp:Transcript_18006/g.20447  ORF Transcript_18006/g.20447 Transcript_18006/m.20447 type:complete len:202 (-) Transcript_18006:62-667(-)